MFDIKHTYTIQWVGPFYSYEEYLQYFKEEHALDQTLFNLYYFETRKDRRYKDIVRYLGIHKKNDGIKNRLKTSHEHLSKYLDNKDMKIWIGSFGNEKDQKPNNIDIVETLLIRSHRDILSENRDKKKSLPKDSVCVINMWFDTKNNLQKYRVEKPYLDDVILYYAEDDTFMHGSLYKMNI